MILLATIMILAASGGKQEAKQNESSRKMDNKTGRNEKVEVDKNLGNIT
jgi:hypothetical protein